MISTGDDYGLWHRVLFNFWKSVRYRHQEPAFIPRFSKVSVIKILAFILIVLFAVVFSAEYTKAAENKLSAENLILAPGYASEEVEIIQGYLASLGYHLKIDGYYDKNTENKVADFQKTNDLDVDGIVGKETVSTLENNLRWHEIKGGETLWQLATRHETTVEILQKINRLDSSTIHPGEKILVPAHGRGRSPTDLTSYIIRRGDTLEGIADRSGATKSDLLAINNLEDPDYLKSGQSIKIPEKIQSEKLIFPLSWPVPERGRITSGFGKREDPFGPGTDFHGGVDVAVSRGTPVLAAAAGRVVDAGKRRAAGKIIIIEHGNNVRTSYAHNKRSLVKPGQIVERGQKIALSGNTGRSTGPHLDFRVRKKGELRDPIKFTNRPAQ